MAWLNKAGSLKNGKKIKGYLKRWPFYLCIIYKKTMVRTWCWAVLINQKSYNCMLAKLLHNFLMEIN